MLDVAEESLLDVLTSLCDAIAWGRPADANKLYSLTSHGTYPERVSRLAEAFGMMLVKIESREYQTSQLINDLTLRNATLEEARTQLAARNVHLMEAIQGEFQSRHVIGQSSVIRHAVDLALTIARRPINTLILGPSGTGKEVFARLIHNNSPRKDGPFVAVNCTAIPDTLFESEMFGIEKGIATGVNAHAGLIEESNGGTLFLDELGELPLANQAKLLRVLEERTVVRVGSAKGLAVDVNVIAATNVDLATAVREGRFREDLYYRLNVVEITLPPLRERGDDILLLGQVFLERHCAEKRRPPLTLSPAAREVLLRYAWPGNVRELHNEMERAAALTHGDTLEVADLSPRILQAVPECAPHSSSAAVPAAARTEPASVLFPLQEMERHCVVAALKQTKTRSEAASLLGITREGLRKKMLRLGIQSE